MKKLFAETLKELKQIVKDQLKNDVIDPTKLKPGVSFTITDPQSGKQISGVIAAHAGQTKEIQGRRYDTWAFVEPESGRMDFFPDMGVHEVEVKNCIMSDHILKTSHKLDVDIILTSGSDLVSVEDDSENLRWVFGKSIDEQPEKTVRFLHTIFSKVIARRKFLDNGK